MVKCEGKMSKITEEKLKELAKELLENSYRENILQIKLEKLGIQTFDVFSDVCENVALSLLGIPEDNTCEKNIPDHKIFCRDFCTWIIYDYIEGKITVDKAIEYLLSK